MRTAMLTVLATCAATGFGCKSDGRKTYELRSPHVEVFTRPPDENRYNHPPEKGYTAPPPTKEFRPGPGAMQSMNQMGQGLGN